jgi:hypothetical protein
MKQYGIYGISGSYEAMEGEFGQEGRSTLKIESELLGINITPPWLRRACQRPGWFVLLVSFLKKISLLMAL